ncbi:hypothetical protein C8R41DRAFT_355219 [Lentinula lateritia]|uniref:MI domain-containing protein n=1 Tax=Lentinula lateritia TaxID=40482 RepID=A0ABQ8VZZ7_9AGAR|nr:hypothetical protein C8R41DRAFT_355219 [Lentinula lateritia]
MKTSTTRLPSTLLEQIQESDGTTYSNRRRSQKPSRKESRKQLRAERKHRKAEFFSNHNLKRPAAPAADSPPKKKVKFSVDVPQKPASFPKASTSKSKNKVSFESNGRDQAKAPPKATALEKLGSKQSKSLSLTTPIRTQQEKKEDAYIAYLEAKLGYSKGKKAKRLDDGLDDLFDFADSLKYPFINGQDELPHRADESEPEENSEDESEDDEGIENEDLGGEEEEEEEEKDVNDLQKLEHGASDAEGEGEEDEWHGIGQRESTGGISDEDTSEVPEVFVASSAPTTRYVPPHLRVKDETKGSEEQIRLIRQIKGFLNRMSEQNISSILDSVEETYRNFRRHDVTSTITTLIIDSISSHSILLDSYVVLHAAFVSSLHKIVGVEFAAYFVQNVVLSFEQHIATLSSPEENVEDKGKEASNLVVLLSELYNFQVISCVLIFDIIRTLLKNEVHEFQVELLLKLVRNSGQQLRADDPLALKDIIQIVQDKIDKQEDALSSRTRFMLETLHNLKVNKVKRLGTQNQGGEAVERMKKFLVGINKKRHVLAHEPLRVTLDDLHSAETKGKWWLVGAAWGGDPLVDRQQGNGQAAAPNPTQNGDNTTSNALLKLAKEHGMNTDIRRSIFVVLMSSDDYVDACERLSQLNLTEVQQREIVRVVLHCCGNEKVYNPYYVLVCQHLCTISHSYKITLQYCLWDFFRDLGETNVGGAEVIKGLQEGSGDNFGVKSISSTRIKNIAKAYAWWIAKDSVTLAVLKPIDFTMLKSQTQMFLQQLFVYLFLSSQSKSPLISANTSSSRNRSSIEEVFVKASRLQTLAMGLVFFLSKRLSLAENDEVDQDIAKLVKWGTEIAKDTLRSRLDIVPDL